ncbi:MAG: sigma-70 family RNA polymerase sigma factor [bacterium]|nr:sigma-70 family RNA polymerase sigma factor [bacterium]
MTAEPPSDLELVREFRGGNERAFNELVLRHRRNVQITIAGMIGNADEAEDITQEVFVRAYQSIGGFRGDSAFYTWLYRIAVNLSLNVLRQRKTRSFFGLEQVQQATSHRERPDEELERTELSVHARAAIAELPEKQRAVFILRHFQRLPHAEIAKIMDRDEGTIKANYFQAVRKLRKTLGPYLEGKE